MSVVLPSRPSWRARHALVAVLALVGAGLAVAPQARGAAVEADVDLDTDAVVGLSYLADAGEANDLRITVREAPPSGTDRRVAVRFADAVPVRLGPDAASEGCRQAGPRAVECTTGLSVSVDLRDGRDEARATGAEDLGLSFALGPGDDTLDLTAAAFGVVARGEAGDDRLTGGPAADVLDGGGGGDVLLGNEGLDELVPDDDGEPAGDTVDGGPAPGPGVDGDRLVYDGRNAERIDLAEGRAGTEGEEDRVAGVEQVVAGRGDDTVLGTDGIEVLLGGAGDDHLAGRGGADLLQGGRGGDRVSGGDGDDRVVGLPEDRDVAVLRRKGRRPAGDRVDCGGGRDRVDLPSPRDLLRRACELVVGDVKLADGSPDFATTLPGRRRGRAVLRILAPRDAESPDFRRMPFTIVLRDAQGRLMGRRRVVIRQGRRRTVRVRLTGPGRRARTAAVRITSRALAGEPLAFRARL